MSAETQKADHEDDQLSAKDLEGAENKDSDESLSSIPPTVKKSKIQKLIELSLFNEPDYRGNWWLTCPFCGEDQLNFNVKKWQYYCYNCDQGRGKNLTHLMQKLGIE